MQATNKAGAADRSGMTPAEPGLPALLASIARRIARGRVRLGDLAMLFTVAAWKHMAVPMFLSPAVCGFPSPADDYLDGPLDFNDLLIRNPAATFAVKIDGDSMRDAGIFPGDIAVVDRSMSAWNGCIVLALLDGEFTVKRYRLIGGRVVLQPENRAFRAIEVTEESGFEVWGVVKNTIRML